MLTRRFLARQDGSVLPFVAASMVVILGFGAISVDAGQLYAKKLALQNVADAAALAGVCWLPTNPNLATQSAIDFAQLNGVSASNVAVSVEGSAANHLRVTAHSTMSLGFARVLGFSAQTVVASSAATGGATRRAKGALPFGIEEAPFVIGQEYVLKLDSDSETSPISGNFHALALGLPGANTYRQNVQHGYQGWLSVGDRIETEPGNMDGPTGQGLTTRLNADSSATYENHLPSSPRVLLVPIIRSFDVNGRKEVEVMGFASFFLEDYRIASSSGEVVGRFLKRVVEGESDDTGTVTNYGTSSVKLIR